MRTVFFGTPDIAVPTLQAVEALHDVVAVVCQPDKPQGRSKKPVPPPVKVAAEKLGIPVHQPVKLNDGTFEAWLREQAPDVCTIAAYGRILKQPVLDIPPQGWLNVHPSLLPKYRGPSPIRSAILHGDTETGVSIMRLVLEMDAGDVLLQERVTIGENESAVALAKRLGMLGADLMLKGLRQLEEGTAVFTPQDTTKVVECRMFEKQDGRIQWGSSAETIHNLVRAAQPWPIAHCHMNGEVYRIHATERIEGNAMAEPGTIEHVMKDRLVVATGDGRLAITQIQAPGKRMMDVGDFLRGHRLEPGASFTDIA